MWMLHVVMCEGCTADVDVTCSEVSHLGIIIFSIIHEHFDAVPSSCMVKNIVVVQIGPLHLQPFHVTVVTSLL
jgi:hypothetical protein